MACASCEQVEAHSGEDDETAARRAWEAHLQRNDSFVVDTMHGQYKSVRMVLWFQIFRGCVVCVCAWHYGYCALGLSPIVSPAGVPVI